MDENLYEIHSNEKKLRDVATVMSSMTYRELSEVLRRTRPTLDEMFEKCYHIGSLSFAKQKSIIEHENISKDEIRKTLNDYGYKEQLINTINEVQLKIDVSSKVICTSPKEIGYHFYSPYFDSYYSHEHEIEYLPKVLFSYEKEGKFFFKVVNDENRKLKHTFEFRDLANLFDNCIKMLVIGDGYSNKFKNYARSFHIEYCSSIKLSDEEIADSLIESLISYYYSKDSYLSNAIENDFFINALRFVLKNRRKKILKDFLKLDEIPNEMFIVKKVIDNDDLNDRIDCMISSEVESFITPYGHNYIVESKISNDISLDKAINDMDLMIEKYDCIIRDEVYKLIADESFCYKYLSDYFSFLINVIVDFFRQVKLELMKELLRRKKSNLDQ